MPIIFRSKALVTHFLLGSSPQPKEVEGFFIFRFFFLTFISIIHVKRQTRPNLKPEFTGQCQHMDTTPLRPTPGDLPLGHVPRITANSEQAHTGPGFTAASQRVS